MLFAHLLQGVTHHVVSHLHKAPKSPQLCAPRRRQSELELLSSVGGLLWKQQMLLCCMSICVLRLSQLDVAVLQQHTGFCSVACSVSRLMKASAWHCLTAEQPDDIVSYAIQSRLNFDMHNLDYTATQLQWHLAIAILIDSGHCMINTGISDSCSKLINS